MQRNEKYAATQYFLLHGGKIGRFLGVKEARGNDVAAASSGTDRAATTLRPAL